MDDHYHHQSAISVTQKPSHHDLIHGGLPKKKPRSFGVHIIRVALYMLNSGKSKQTKNHKTTSLWKKLLGSMRPFHHVQCANNPPPLLTGLETQKHQLGEKVEVFSPPLSPAKGSRASSSFTEPSSRYASAENLQELDECDGSEEEEGYFDDCAGDEMIDEKAEMFIAQFYEQMRLQREAYAT